MNINYGGQKSKGGYNNLLCALKSLQIMMKLIIQIHFSLNCNKGWIFTGDFTAILELGTSKSLKNMNILNFDKALDNNLTWKWTFGY